MSVAETQKLSEILRAICDLTGARIVVCDRDGQQLAVCPEMSEQPAGEPLRMPLLQEGVEVGHILWDTAVPSDGAVEADRLRGAAKLIELMIASMNLSDRSGPARRSLQQTILDYIEGNLSENLSGQALCRRFSISRSELYRLLREQAPQGVAAYIRGKRFQKACELLRDTNKPIWQVAEAVGYDDPNYFLRAFRREIGISAGKYRKGA